MRRRGRDPLSFERDVEDEFSCRETNNKPHRQTTTHLASPGKNELQRTKPFVFQVPRDRDSRLVCGGARCDRARDWSLHRLQEKRLRSFGDKRSDQVTGGKHRRTFSIRANLKHSLSAFFAANRAVRNNYPSRRRARPQ